ncbi:hypothetical protein D9613_008007 [Agrocybe pediades]|uniref:Carboxylic ester hydrolase n=1 Tax=Agrocybe pediades TaxID=84607 RepID=A0A8H4QMC6_9AGAR|nr:hypothetical protein D9613_008007 [Agrocybe pediades]
MKVDQRLLITLTSLAFTAPLAAAGAVARSSSDDATSSANATTPVVDLGYAKYQGTIVKDSVTGSTNSQFLGIRFAAPPTGALRFSAPAPPSSTPGVQLANTQPPICFQTGPWGLSSTSPFPQQNGTSARLPVMDGGEGNSDPRFSEDCLFLNVVTPGRIGEKKNLPVVVWIYGGGYATGSASDSGFGTFYDGNDLVRESGGEVVAVLLQYRLGAFGFLAGEKVKKGGALNAGLLDQQFALKWVQNHISKFGGDPRKVTIWGESAGAGSVMQHVIANGGKTKPSLFRAAITSSAYLPSQYKYNSHIPETIYSQVVSLTNCTSSADTLECLRQAPVEILQAANAAILQNGFFGTFTFVPVVDGSFITDSPTNLIRQGKVNTKNLYSVTNSFEGDIFVNQTQASTMPATDYISQLYPTLSTREVAAIAKKYSGLGSNFTQAALIMGDSILVCPTYLMLNNLGRSTFKAEFAFPPATHGADLSYYFNGGKFAEGVNVDAATAFTQSFMNFVKNLNPSVQDTPSNISLAKWKPWNGRNEMVFNQTSTGAADVRPVSTSADRLTRCRLWESLSRSTSQ